MVIRFLLPIFIMALLASCDAYGHPLCNLVDRDAEIVMEVRQSGINRDSFHCVSGNVPLCEIMRDDAYSKPRWHTEHFKQKEIERFALGWYLKCIEMIGLTI